MIKKKKEGKGGWYFLEGVLLLYVGTLLFAYPLAKEAFTQFLLLLKTVLPILLVVFVVLFLSELFFKPKKVKKLLGENAGVKGWLVAIVGGIISTGPAYLWYPLLAEMKEHGMREALIAAFLYNRAIKIQFLPLLFFYFGVVYTIVLSIYMILFSILNGFTVEKILERKKHPMFY